MQAPVISDFDSCSALPTGLPACIRPLQMIQNAAQCLVFDQTKEPHTHDCSFIRTDCTHVIKALTLALSGQLNTTFLPEQLQSGKSG